MSEKMFIQAINEAIAEEMRRDEKVVVIGQDVKVSVFGATTRLFEEFGGNRVIQTPVSEAAGVGSALGLAVSGFRPIVELVVAGFSALVASDQILNQVTKIRYRTGGQAKAPMVFLFCYGGTGSGVFHTQSLYPIFMHFPGLKIAIPSTPHDAKGLMKTAIRDENPVAFFLSAPLHLMKGHVPEEEYITPFGEATILREGKDLTMVATGFCVHQVLKVASEYLNKRGYSAEVIDIRTPVPLDKQTILDSVKKTGKVIIVDEAQRTCGLASEIAATVVEQGFAFLKAPIKRVTPLDAPIPSSTPLGNYLVLNEEKIIKAAEEVLAYGRV